MQDVAAMQIVGTLFCVIATYADKGTQKHGKNKIKAGKTCINTE
jgi:hypothetical protein